MPPLIDPARWRVLEPLLDEVLDLEPDQRPAWLAELRSRAPDDARDVVALLAAEGGADRRGFLDAPLGLAGAGARQLGGWTLVRPLGRGGMGVVWLARRGDETAALKLLNLTSLSVGGRERFAREGAVLARLTAHPGIARLIETGMSTAAESQPWLVLEYVDGTPIDAYVEAHALSVHARIRLVLEVLAAVGHAHAHDVVHRDLKPSNILVRRDGRVVLLDFGIAKLLAPDASGEWPAVTTERSRALTPEFAAPEQITGRAVTAATDVYAAGVLLYVLLAGRHPTAEGCATRADVVRAQLASRVEPLGFPALDAILETAMQKDSRARHQSAEAFAAELRGYLRATPEGVPRPRALVRLRAFVGRQLGRLGA